MVMVRLLAEKGMRRLPSKKTLEGEAPGGTFGFEIALGLVRLGFAAWIYGGLMFWGWMVPVQS